MSEENVEVVHRAFAEFERGNFGELEFYDPEVRVVWLDLVGEESETIGLQGMSDFMKKMFETFEHLSLAAERIVDAGDNQVVVVAVWRGKGRASGAHAEWRHAVVWTIRDGQVASIIGHAEPKDALKAAGLSE